MLKGCVNEAVEGAGMCLQSGLCCSGGGGGGGRLVSDSTIAMGGKEESFSSQGLRMPERSPLPSALPLRSCSSHLSHKYL